MTRWMKASVLGQHQKPQSRVLMCVLVHASVSKKARAQWMSVCYRETQGQMALQKAWVSRDGENEPWCAESVFLRLPPQGWSFFNTSMANTLVKSTSGAQEALLTISPYTLQVFGQPRWRQFGLWRLFSKMPHHPSPTPHPNTFLKLGSETKTQTDLMTEHHLQIQIISVQLKGEMSKSGKVVKNIVA